MRHLYELKGKVGNWLCVAYMTRQLTHDSAGSVIYTSAGARAGHTHDQEIAGVVIEIPRTQNLVRVGRGRVPGNIGFRSKTGVFMRVVPKSQRPSNVRAPLSD